MSKLKLTRNQKLTIGIISALLLVAIGGTVAWVNYMSSVNKEEPIALTPIEDVQAAALEYASSDDIDGGLAFYDDEIKKRDDDGEKKRLLLYKSSFARQAGRSEEALAATKQADEISPDAATAEALAKAYDASGDLEQALIYYKRALELSPKEGMGARYNSILEERIRELEQ